MDTGVIRHYSEAPLPLLIMAFVGVIAAGAAARSRSLTVIALAAAVAAGAGFPTELMGFGLSGYFALWTLARFSSRSLKGPGNAMVGAAWVVLVAAWTQGFPFTWTWNATLCRSSLKNIGTALEMYQTDYQVYPTSLDRLTPEYLKAPAALQPGDDLDLPGRADPDRLHDRLHGGRSPRLSRRALYIRTRVLPDSLAAYRAVGSASWHNEVKKASQTKGDRTDAGNRAVGDGSAAGHHHPPQTLWYCLD